MPRSNRSVGVDLAVQAYAELGAELLRGLLWEGRMTVVETDAGPVQLQWQLDPLGEKRAAFFARVRCRHENRQDLWFSLHRKTLFSPLRRLLGPPTISTAHPDINRHFLVSTNDRAALNALLGDAELQRLLGAYSPLRFELKDDRGWYGNSAPGLVDMLYLETIVTAGDEAGLRPAFDLLAATLNGLARLPARPRRAAGSGAQIQERPGLPCPTCGEVLPATPTAADLRAQIDSELAREFGPEVERAAWDGPPPDGLRDNLLAWQPAVRQRRAIWQRGRELLAELGRPGGITACPHCTGLGAPSRPTATSAPPAPAWQPPATEPAAPRLPELWDLAEPIQQAARSPVPAPQPATPARPPESESPIPTPSEPPARPARQPTPAAAEPPVPPPAHPSPPLPSWPVAPTPPPSTPAVGLPRLVVIDGPASVGAAFALTRDTVLVGRSLACDVVLDDRAISYQHTRLTRDGDRWLLADLTGSTQTTVNGESVSAPRHLAHGDEVRIGETTIRFESE